MRFQFKLILTYGAFLFLFILALGIYLLQSNTRIILDETVQSYTRVGEVILQQLENIYDQMDFVILNLISQDDFKTAMSTLETISRDDPDFERYYNESASSLRSQLYTYSLQKKYHSIVYFNSRGDFFSSNLEGHRADRIDSPAQEMARWEQLADTGRGTAFIIPPYRDRWGTGERIFGLGRLLRRGGRTVSFLIAQEREEKLEELLSLDKDEHVEILLFTPEGDIFYKTGDVSAEAYPYYFNAEETEGFVPSPVTGAREKIITAPPTENGLKMVIIINISIMADQWRKTRTVIFLGILVLLLFSLLFNYISSRMLTRPLSRITEFMNGMEWGNLPGKLPFSEDSHDEITELNRAFHELIKRLDDSAKREIQMNTGWMQAKMDALQEQVNPHFLYNILTVISQRAYVLGDKEICRTCDDIASMLRYSTSTVSRYATLKDELIHTKAYLSLMKRRLGEELIYSIDVEEELLTEKVPKIILQPLVENALEHGYRSIERIRDICISGKKGLRGWTVSVRDNGQGSDMAKEKEIFRQIKKHLEKGEATEGLQIGGLGLANTYTRLYLTFGPDLVWKINSKEGEGTEVIFGTSGEGGDR